MKVVGIVCEYNPFHNGHRYQMEEARRRSGADAVVCVMSGNYVQRGEGAITDKWTRSRMAIASGADLVIELPTLYAMSGAQSFAQGGVKLLLNAGIDAMSFGCETEDLELLWKIARVLKDEPYVYRDLLRQKLDTGESFAASRASAMASYLAVEEELLEQPGIILGTEYLAALLRCGAAGIEVLPISRLGGGHNDTVIRGHFSSASSIREALRQGEFPQAAMPEESAAIWQKAAEKGRILPDLSVFTQRLYWRLAESDATALSRIPEMGEGLENRILRKAWPVRPWDELVRSIVCKRYPAARIRRGLMNLCLGITQNVRDECGWEDGPAYIRVLGIGSKGEEILRRIKAEGNLPVLSRPASQLDILSPAARRMFMEEVKYTDYYMLSLSARTSCGKEIEYRQEIVKKRDQKRYSKKIIEKSPKINENR